MAAFMHFSFEDFEIPPLDAPISLTVATTEDSDVQTRDVRSETGIDRDVEDEIHLDTPRQQSTSSERLSELDDRSGPRSKSRDTAPIDDDGWSDALTKSPEHRLQPVTILNNLAPAQVTNAANINDPLEGIPQGPAVKACGVPKSIRITSDGWSYRSIDISAFQTAQDVRAAMGDSLGLEPGISLLVYVTATDRVTAGEALTDEALMREVLHAHNDLDVKFMVLQSTQSARASPQSTGRVASRTREPEYTSPHPTSLHRLNSFSHDEARTRETYRGDEPSKHSIPHSVGSSHRGLRIDTSSGVANGVLPTIPVPDHKDDRSSWTPYEPPRSEASAGEAQTMFFAPPSGNGLHTTLSNRYRPPRTQSPLPCDYGEMLRQDKSTRKVRNPRKDEQQSAQVQIRDGSRARNTPADFASGELCDDCQTCGVRRFYCNVCSFVFCEPCWERQFPHRMRPVPGALPHEKTDHHVAKKIGNVLTPQLKEEQREKLHMDDIDTTWFGVVREGHERPLLQDYGRYATLIAGIKELRLGSVSSLSAGSDDGEVLYPSLVSFVGQTGAGKSSLIKLLIDLKSDEHETFETPVVGAAGRDVATSEDVHLYLDPDSSESQVPLLFADCEGLEGGERDPVGAKLKRKLASSQNNTSSSRRKPTSERELVWADTPKKQSRDFAVAHLYPRLLYTFSDVIVFVLKNPRYVCCTTRKSWISKSVGGATVSRQIGYTATLTVGCFTAQI